MQYLQSWNMYDQFQNIPLVGTKLLHQLVGDWNHEAKCYHDA